MIIQKGKIISNKGAKINCFNYGDYTIYYKGLIFVSGYKCGNESIECILDNFENINYENIFGNFFIYIINNKINKQYCFIDNSGMFKVYRYKDCISTSFLELIEYFDEINIDNLDFDSVTEFLHFGFTYFDNTLIRDIKRIDSNDIVIFEKERLILESKGLNNINSPSNITIEKFFSDLIYAIKDNKISIDLTGGFDSRLITSFFHKENADFELAISGKTNSKDIKIGKKISSKINKNYYITFHSVENISEELFSDIFELSDSQIDIVDYHRINQLSIDRQLRNIDIHLNGAGGELYKDFWWLQDFPFYNRPTTNLKKLYKLRIESTRFPHSILGKKLKQKSLSFETNTINKLNSLVLETNTKSYDNIQFNYKMKTNAGVYNTIANNLFISYSPLLELQLARLCFNLKRLNRFFYFFHKRIITKNDPILAKMQTTEGITASTNLLYILSDTFFYSYNILKRISKVILRKIFNKTFFLENPTDSSIYDSLRKDAFFHKNVKLLMKYNILEKNVKYYEIPNKLIGKILTIGFFIERLEKN